MKIGNIHQSRKCRLSGDSDETIHHIISEWSELSQKGVKLEFDYTQKCYMNK